MIDPSHRTPRLAWRPLSAVLAGLAGALGAAGVAISAAAAHKGGGDIASTAGLFCLLHAATVLALVALYDLRGGRLLPLAAAVLVVGTVLFAGDLALAGLMKWRPVPVAAPIGGSAMIVGWLLVTVAGVLHIRGPR